MPTACRSRTGWSRVSPPWEALTSRPVECASSSPPTEPSGRCSTWIRRRIRNAMCATRRRRPRTSSFAVSCSIASAASRRRFPSSATSTSSSARFSPAPRLSFAADCVVWHPTRNRGRQLLRAQWIYNRGYAAREGRAGRTPEGLRWQALVPIVSVARSRKWWGRSYGPDTRWLGENNVVPTRTETTQALFLMYLVVPYVRAAAQLRGWLEGRRLRSDGPAADGHASETR